jgi:hypothetical protein
MVGAFLRGRERAIFLVLLLAFVASVRLRDEGSIQLPFWKAVLSVIDVRGVPIRRRHPSVDLTGDLTGPSSLPLRPLRPLGYTDSQKV